MPQQPPGRVEHRGSVGVLVGVHPTGHHRGSQSGRSSIERRMCHRGQVRPGRLTRVGRHAPAGQSGQDSDGYLRAQRRYEVTPPSGGCTRAPQQTERQISPRTRSQSEGGSGRPAAGLTHILTVRRPQRAIMLGCLWTVTARPARRKMPVRDGDAVLGTHRPPRQPTVRKRAQEPTEGPTIDQSAARAPTSGADRGRSHATALAEPVGHPRIGTSRRPTTAAAREVAFLSLPIRGVLPQPGSAWLGKISTAVRYSRR